MSAKNIRENNESKHVPGPGQYNANTNSNRLKSPSYKMGTAQRGTSNKYAQANPGPGQYGADNCAQTCSPTTLSWVIGTSKRPLLNTNDLLTPGVGNYNVSQGLGKGPKHTISGKKTYENNWKKSIPGPGQYNQDSQVNLRKSSSIVIGKSSREDGLKRTIKDNFPGPGMYDYQLKDKGPKYRFGSEERASSAKNAFPGPGQYQIPCSIVDVNDYTRQAGNFDPNYRYV